jgi:hypothetical protein
LKCHIELHSKGRLLALPANITINELFELMSLSLSVTSTPSLIFAGNLGVYPEGLHSKGSLTRKYLTKVGLKVTTVLAYYATELNTAIKFL